MCEAAIHITQAETRDIPALTRLWVEVFKDPVTLVEDFFGHFPPTQSGWIVRRDAEILSTAYLLQGNVFLSNGRAQEAAYIYAVATPKQQRGRGYGGMLMRHFQALAEERRLLLYTKPADAGLYHWYAKTMQAVPVGHACARTVVAADEADTRPAPKPLTASEYGAVRKQRLHDRPHIVMSDAFLALQERFLRQAGGGYFALGDACCACEKQGQTLVVKELFSPAGQENAVAAAMQRYLSAQRATYWILDHAGAPTAAACASSMPEDTAWGLLLD